MTSSFFGFSNKISAVSRSDITALVSSAIGGVAGYKATSL